MTNKRVKVDIFNTKHVANSLLKMEKARSFIEYYARSDSIGEALMFAVNARREINAASRDITSLIFSLEEQMAEEDAAKKVTKP